MTKIVFNQKNSNIACQLICMAYCLTILETAIILIKNLLIIKKLPKKIGCV